MRKIQCETCSLRADGALCHVSSEAMDEFRALGVSTIYKPHQVVFTEGNPCNGLYLVCHGTVKLYHSDRFGRDHILEIVGPRAVIGEFALDDEPLLSVSAEAVSESQLCFLPRDRLAAFLERYPGTGVRLIDALSRDLARTRRKVRDLALKGAESRLAALLVQLAYETTPDPSASGVRVHYSRRELGEMIGVATETVIRLLAKLKDKQVISVERRQIVISDLERLTTIAHYDETEA